MIGLVNLAAVTIFVAVELAFSFFAFPTPWVMLLVAALCISLRLVEVAISWQSRPVSTKIAHVWVSASICVGLGLPFALAAATQQFHTHYFGLLILPVLETALYFSLAATLIVAALASASAFLWVAYAAHFTTPFQLGELLEATTITLLLFTVAALIWALLHLLNQRAMELRERMAELQRVQEQLSEEEKLAAVGRLASAIAHEVRNPVAIIRSAVEASASMDPQNAERDVMASIALTEARRLEKLTTDFLSYAQPGNLLRRDVDVPTLVGYTASIARAQARDKAVEISVTILRSCSLHGNEDQLQQLLLNLLRNAVEASPPGGTIAIRGESDAENVTISVENAGLAIAADTAPMIFEPFFTAKSGGTGLGLSIARKIAEAHGGNLTLAHNLADCIRFDLVLPAQAGRASGAERRTH